MQKTKKDMLRQRLIYSGGCISHVCHCIPFLSTNVFTEQLMSQYTHKHMETSIIASNSSDR